MYLRQFALDTIQKVPCDALQIYADGSMGVGAVSGSENFILKGNGIRISTALFGIYLNGEDMETERQRVQYGYLTALMPMLRSVFSEYRRT
ncbi:hypothetical protein TNCV_4418651 [Trichonephila clavipes]|nr:hypothetical protein TNCV_4418651 [Trichonephila clavipes]